MTERATAAERGPDARLEARGTPREQAELDDVLDALDVGVVVLAPDLSVRRANARVREQTEQAVVPGTPLAALLDGEWESALRELHEVLADGSPRRLTLALRRGAAGSAAVPAVARRVGEGLVLELDLGEPDRTSMHDVARRLAEVADMSEVLRALCEIAARQCGATGSAVLRIIGAMGEVVVASGDLRPARSRCFDLGGSMLADALGSDAVQSEANFRESGRPLMRAVPELALGPVLVAPLRAHGEALGVLAVSRSAGAAAFGDRERERLRLLADHAALAVHKSLLLQQALSADRAKGRFLATMSHELRTPLTALAGYGELLADQVIGPLSEPQLEILERMRSVTTHLSTMIEEILAFSSLEEGREQVRPTEFLVEDLARAAVAVVGHTADQKGIAVELDLPPQSVRMTADVDKARQILINLLANAVKFTDRGTLTLRVRQQGDAVRLDVADTGIGIPAAELPRLFRPFAQVDTGLTRRHGGTGLGLYISRRLATMLGGHIEVASTPGEGSVFTVVLPLA